ncbi:MAG: histidinol-phosphate transaminase [Kiritimatiellia bacterium]|nr:histidinol-phosphate transaminase [Kiritimatiellia bacterium]
MNSLIRACVTKMSAYVPGEQPTNLNVVKLNTNENPYPPSPAVLRALKQINGDNLRRYPDPECKILRSVIAKVHRCSPNQVFVGNGSDEILALCSRAFVEDNSQISFFEPSYSLYPVLARIRNVKSRVIRLGKKFSWPDKQWQMPANCGAGLFYMTNPNSPTGILYPKKAVAQFCRHFKGVVVLDEAYVDFARVNCVDLALKLKNTLVLRTLSKSYSLAGLRVGYAVGPRELIGALLKIKDSYNIGRIAQSLATAAIQDQDYMRANVRRIIATRQKLVRALAAMDFVVLPSDANFLFVKPGGISAETLDRQLRKQNILVRYFAGKQTRDFLRITVGADEQIDKLIEAIAKIIKSKL